MSTMMTTFPLLAVTPLAVVPLRATTLGLRSASIPGLSLAVVVEAALLLGRLPSGLAYMMGCQAIVLTTTSTSVATTSLSFHPGHSHRPLWLLALRHVHL